MASYYGYTSVAGYELRLDIELLSQSIANNSSTVSWNLYLTRAPGTARYSAYQTAWSVDIGGAGAGGYFILDFRNYAVAHLGTGTRTVTHNPNGTGNMYVSGAFSESDPFPGIGNATLGGFFDFPAIPRTSNATLSASSVNAGSPVTIYTNRASNSFTHTISYSFGTKSGTIATGVGDMVAWTPPLSLLTEIPNSTSGSVTITTRTFNGGTSIGTSTTYLTLTAPASVVPSFTTVTNSEAVSNVANNVGAYVQSQSRLNLAITGAAGIYGSTIKSYRMTVAGQTIDASTGLTGVINSSGTVNIVGTVTDSRGRTASKTVPITVLPYTPPTITQYSLHRADAAGTVDENGQYVRADLNISVRSLQVEGVEKNTINRRLSSRGRGETTWTVKTNQQLSGTTFSGYALIGPGYTLEQAWEVLLEVSDLFSTTAAQGTIATAAVFMDWSESGNLGLGKFWERGNLDVLGQIYQNDGKLVASLGDVLIRTLGTENLNTITTPGFYEQTTASAATAARNYPIVQRGVLEVIAQDVVTQRYTAETNGRIYTRTRVGSTWGAWTAYAASTDLTGFKRAAAGAVTTNTTGTGTVTFPTGSFTAAPSVTATIRNYVAYGAIIISARSATSFTYITFNTTNGTNAANIQFDWQAIQQ